MRPLLFFAGIITVIYVIAEWFGGHIQFSIEGYTGNGMYDIATKNAKTMNPAIAPGSSLSNSLLCVVKYLCAIFIYPSLLAFRVILTRLQLLTQPQIHLRIHQLSLH